MAIHSLEDVGIVVEDLAAVTTFFGGLGLDLLGEGKVGSQGWSSQRRIP